MEDVSLMDLMMIECGTPYFGPLCLIRFPAYAGHIRIKYKKGEGVGFDFNPEHPPLQT